MKDHRGDDQDNANREVFYDQTLLPIGCHSFGFEPTDNDRVIVTRWMTLLLIPLIPWRRVECEYLGDGPLINDALEQIRVVTHEFRIVKRLPLSMFSIAKTYCAALLGVAVAVGPMAVIAAHVAGGAGGLLKIAMFVVSCCWMVEFPFLVEWYQKGQLRATWSRERQQHFHEQQQRAAESRIDLWQHQHVIPKWGFILALGLGGSLGLGMAIAAGWRPELAPAVTALVAYGAVAMVDGQLKKNRDQYEKRRKRDVE